MKIGGALYMKCHVTLQLFRRQLPGVTFRSGSLTLRHVRGVGISQTSRHGFMT